MKKIVTFISIIVTFTLMNTEIFGERPPKSDFSLPIINTPQRPFLKWLCDGTKKAEGRVFRSTCRKMQEGATIVLEDKRRGQWVFGRISFLHRYDSFRKMLEKEGVENMLPFLRPGDIDEGVYVYERFPGGRGVLREGCVAIGIEVRENNFGESIKRKSSHQESDVKNLGDKKKNVSEQGIPIVGKRKREEVTEEGISKKAKHLENAKTDCFDNKTDAFSSKDGFSEKKSEKK